MELLNDTWIVWIAWGFLCLGIGFWIGLRVGRATPKTFNAGILPNGTTIVVNAESVWTVNGGKLEEMR